METGTNCPFPFDLHLRLAPKLNMAVPLRIPYPHERLVIHETTLFHFTLTRLYSTLESLEASGNTDEARILRAMINYYHGHYLPRLQIMLQVTLDVCSTVGGTHAVNPSHWNGVLRWNWLTPANANPVVAGQLAEGRAQANAIDGRSNGTMYVLFSFVLLLSLGLSYTTVARIDGRP